MKIAIAGIFHETNTFAPGITTIEGFRADWHTGEASFRAAYAGTRTSMGGALDAAERYGFEAIPAFYAQALPSGMVAKPALDELLDTLVAELARAADRVDGVLLILHGAMVGEDVQDVEGLVLRRARDVVGSMPVAVTIDLHANVSEDMVRHADVIVGYDTYPHIDAYERAMEACELLVRRIRGEVNPVRYLAKTGLLLVPTLMNTNIYPMRDLMEKAFALEQDADVLNVTVAGGFAFSDVGCAGATVLVTTNGDVAKAREYAESLASWLIERKLKFKPQLRTPEEAYEDIRRAGLYPAALVESSDNVGGGSPADATHVLKFLVERNAPKFLCVIADPEAVAAAFAAGVGGVLSAAVGGKADAADGRPPLHGEPVPIRGEVRLLAKGDYAHKGPYMSGMKTSMGRTAVVDLPEGATVILTEKRVAPWDVNHVRSVGVDPEAYDLLVVKASVAWRAAFGDIVRNVVELDTPGCCSSNLKHFRFRHLEPDVELV